MMRLKKDIFAVCDTEVSYVLRLMEFIQQKQGAIFEVQAFTNVKSLCEFAEKQKISLLLISARAMCQEVRALPVGRIMILSEGEMRKELEEYPCIYKYQASDSLVSEVMGYYAVENQTAPQALFKKDRRCMAVYSPVRRALKTSFALTLGQLLSRDRHVLYLNLESFSGFFPSMKQESDTDIADLMYFVKRGVGNVAYRLQGMVRSLGNLDYIPPAVSPMDIRSVTGAEWMTLLGEIETYSIYDTVILDFDEMVDGFLDILRHCDTIYMPVREDSLSVAKLRQYESFLKLCGYGDLTEKTRKLKLPFHSSFGSGEHYIEQLIWGELGDFTRNLIREEGADGENRGTHSCT